MSGMHLCRIRGQSMNNTFVLDFRKIDLVPYGNELGIIACRLKIQGIFEI